MITKAIVEYRIDEFKYKVRIPLFDRVDDSPQHKDLSELATATVCVSKGINNSIKVGDVVFVGFEDNSASRPIILGHLYRDDLIKDNTSFLNISNLTASDQVSLPLKTVINDLNIYEALLTLTDTVDKLKAQIEALQQE